MDSLPTPPFPSQPSPLFSPLAAVDKSIETQVSEARKRAQQYADAVRAAKEREAKSIQSLEAEKNKWIESYEKKSMLVNQLERELSSAVEMIESQRRSSSVDALGGTTVPLLSDATIHENLKKLLALSTSRQSGDRDASRNAASGDSSHALLGHSVDASRLEHSSHALDRGRAFDQLAEMQDQISALTDEVTQLKLSRDDLSGKLQFRMNQISDFEHEKIRQKNELKAFQQRIEELESRLYSTEMQCKVITGENERYVADIQRLEERLYGPSHQQHEQDLQKTIMDQQLVIQDLQGKLTTKDQLHSEELQQLKHIIQSLQLRLRGNGPLPLSAEASLAYRVGGSTPSIPPSSVPAISPIVRSDQSLAPNLSYDGGVGPFQQPAGSFMRGASPLPVQAASMAPSQSVPTPTTTTGSDLLRPIPMTTPMAEAAWLSNGRLSREEKSRESSASCQSRQSDASVASSQAPTPHLVAEAPQPRPPHDYSVLPSHHSLASVEPSIPFGHEQEEEEGEGEGHDESKEAGGKEGRSHRKSSRKSKTSSTKRSRSLSAPRKTTPTTSTPTTTTRSPPVDPRSSPKIPTQPPHKRSVSTERGKVSRTSPVPATKPAKEVREKDERRTPSTSRKAAVVTPQSAAKDMSSSALGRQLLVSRQAAVGAAHTQQPPAPPSSSSSYGAGTMLFHRPVSDGKERRMLQVMLPSSPSLEGGPSQPQRATTTMTTPPPRGEERSGTSTGVREASRKAAAGRTSSHVVLLADHDAHDQSLVSLSTTSSSVHGKTRATMQPAERGAASKGLSFVAYKSRLVATSSSPNEKKKAVGTPVATKTVTPVTGSRRLVSA